MVQVQHDAHLDEAHRVPRQPLHLAGPMQSHTDQCDIWSLQHGVPQAASSAGWPTGTKLTAHLTRRGHGPSILTKRFAYSGS